MPNALVDNDLLQPIGSPDALNELDAPESNPFMEADPMDKNGFDHMDDLGGDLDNPFGGDDLGNMDYMHQHSRNSKTERNLLEPALSKNDSLMQSDSIFGQKPILKNSLSELLPSMDMAEPDAEDSDQDENPFGEDADMK